MKQSTKDKITEFMRKFRDLFTPKAKRRLAIALSAVLIGGAVYLNWLFFFGNNTDGEYNKDAATDGGASDIIGTADGNTLGDVVKTGADAADNNIDLTVSDASSYFAVTTINRQRARDEAIEVLQSIIDDVNALDQDKGEALTSMREIAESIKNEANIEALVGAKGFSNCVAVISRDCCTVVVSTSGLLPNQVAQIQEIVYQQAGILPLDVNIIEKIV